MINWPAIIADILAALRWHDSTAADLSHRLKLPELTIVCALTGPCLTGDVVLELVDGVPRYRRVR